MRKTAIFGLFIVILLVSGASCELSKLNTNSKDKEIQSDLVMSCEQDFEYYVNILESKYSTRVSTIKIEEIKSMEEAENFFNTWKSSLAMQYLVSKDFESLGENNPAIFGAGIDNFPVVMIVAKFKTDTEMPLVLGCDGDGKLTSYSKRALLM